MINFKKYRTFTNGSFISCYRKICELLPSIPKIIISKPVYEADIKALLTLSKTFPNNSYIIVEDLSHNKGLNRERDDTLILLFNFLLLENDKKTLIVSNDQYNNYNFLLASIKPVLLTIIKDGQTYNKSLSNEQAQSLVEYSTNILKKKKYTDINKSGFYTIEKAHNLKKIFV